MIIGLDFDNCIVNYQCAIEKLIKDEKFFCKNKLTGLNKESLKEIIIKTYNEEKWTLIQGKLYGKYIKYAKPYPYVLETIKKLLKNNVIYIISHKTKTPFIGKKYDLHDAASKWINNNLVDENLKPIIDNKFIYFNQTINQKVQSISKVKCNIFLDDLIKVLQHETFPNKIKKVLFNPNKIDIYFKGIETVNNWKEFYTYVKQKNN